MGKGNPHRSGAKGAQSDRHYYGRKGNVTTGERPATRSRGSKLVDDPDVVEKQLNALLKSMKLYASQTSGDGNCLFRALSDQLYGSPDAHPQLRREICDYIEASPERFSGFVEVEKPFAEYVRNMRQSGVYGGHLELSAFASLKHKEIKIVQPGLVYRVTGHDDSPEAVAERAAIESRREARQARQASGSERPPAAMTKGGVSAREMRRRKRGEGRQSSSSSAMAVDDDAEQAVAGTSKLAGEEEEEEEEDDGPVEAFGPLYIAYHNWEHYSSLRNVDGPHSGLPRIKEFNVASAAQTSPPVATKGGKRGQGGKGADYEDEDDEDEYRPLKPTEHEDLILRSVPGHTLQEVRHLLKQHGNLWETVVEVLIAQDAQGGRESPKSSSTTQAYMTRSRGVSHSYLSNSSNNANGAAPSRYDQRSPLLPVPEHLRTESDAASSSWRQASPASSSGGDANSASTHATTTTASSSGDAATSVATTVDPRGSASPTQRGGIKLGSKRAASVDPLDLGDESSAAPSPKRRSSSREREREERSVDGALASEFDAAAKTVDGGASDESGNPSSAQSPATTLALSPQETTSQGDSTRPTTPARASAQEYSSTSFTYPLQSSRGLLSPPLSPSSINREEVRGMSKAEKREIELKRKRDRQRERRAKDRQLKESKAARAKDKEKPVAKGKKGAAGAAAATVTAAAPISKAAAAANRRRLNRLAEEEEEREREQGRKGRGSGGSGGGSDVPKGFVELKI